VNTALTREAIVAAFRDLGERAWSHGLVIDLAVYGGSCLALVSNFRISTRDVDAVALTDQVVTDRLAAEVASHLGLPAAWLNDGVRTYLSPMVDAPAAHHQLFATYPSEERPGLRVFVPNAAYMLAMKLMALRIDPAAETQDFPDILALLDVVGLARKEAIVEFVASFYPEARISGKLHLGIDAIWRAREDRRQHGAHEPPQYLGRRGPAR
jgi:hypothetical protein